MADPRRDTIIAEARARLGVPYRLDPPPDGINTLDCSLYVLKVSEAAGVPLAGVRTAEQIRAAMVPVGWPDVLPGDCLFFTHTYEPSETSAVGDGEVASHIGISLGAGSHKMLNAVEPVSKESDISSDYWQQHLLEARRHPALVDAAVPPSDGLAWQFFPADAITRATSATIDHVRLYWPKLVAQLVLCGINDRLTQIAVLATIVVEVGPRFEPIHEYGTPADWAGYSGGAAYAGRGFIQLTHDYNYRAYSQKINDLWRAGGAIDLVARPDDALDPDIASAVMALYFRDHGVPALAAAGNWAGIRRAVNGGMNGWQTFADAVEALKAISVPTPPVPAPPAVDPRDAQIAQLQADLADARSKLGVAAVDYVKGLRDLANAYEALKPA